MKISLRGHPLMKSHKFGEFLALIPFVKLKWNKINIHCITNMQIPLPLIAWRHLWIAPYPALVKLLDHNFSKSYLGMHKEWTIFYTIGNLQVYKKLPKFLLLTFHCWPVLLSWLSSPKNFWIKMLNYTFMTAVISFFQAALLLSLVNDSNSESN